jgi:hypothetical protein
VGVGVYLYSIYVYVRAQIESLMGDPQFAKSHHYAAEFRKEGDGDIWDGNVLREWTSEKRS